MQDIKCNILNEKKTKKLPPKLDQSNKFKSRFSRADARQKTFQILVRRLPRSSALVKATLSF